MAGDDRTHEMESGTCWCNPLVRQFCPECDGIDWHTNAPCYRCGGAGLVEPYDVHQPTVITHNRDEA